MTKRILYVVNVDWFFVSHRLPIAREALGRGYEVHVATGITDKLEMLRAEGFVVHPLSIGRSSLGPVREGLTLLAMVSLFRRVRPDVVHLVTIKPVLFGGIAARLARVRCVVAAVSGLGAVFLAKGAKASVLRGIVTMLYRIALGHRNVQAIFQNPDDRDLLVGLGVISADRTSLIRGSGVSLRDYPCVTEPAAGIVVTLAARLLKDKGVEEFVAAARLLRERGVNARFCLVGDPDPDNPASVTAADLDVWRQEGCVELLGYRSDIADVFGRSNLVVLPSYREGLPKVLIEAAACGRAVVTTDVPGCRDAIDAGETGLLVPARDAAALADSIQKLIEDPQLRRQLGQNGRRLAEREFTIEKVIEQHFQVYAEVEARA